jgi:hypothetical protein
MELTKKLKREGAVFSALVSNYGIPNFSAFTGGQLMALFSDEMNALKDRVAFMLNDEVDKKTALSFAAKDVDLPLRIAILSAAKIEDLPEPEVAPSQLSQKQKSLFPFLVSKSSKIDNDIVGFRSTKEGVPPLWFSVVSKNNNDLYCLGYNGESRLLNLEKIYLSGYVEVEGMKRTEKMQACREDFPDGTTKNDVKVVNFHISMNAISQAEINKGKIQLHNLVHSIPEIDAKKQLKPVDALKI